jgi:hypothetical protein
MDATFRGADYHVVSNLTTGGMVNALWQAEIQATSSGKVVPKALEPALYDSYDIHGDKKQQVSLTYDGAAAPRLYAQPAYSTTGYEVKPEDQKNTLDPLSAFLQIVSGVAATPNNPCSVTAPVFDGRRRYNVEMSKDRDIDIKMDNGLYQGRGTLCSLKYHQLAGYKPRVLNHRARTRWAQLCDPAAHLGRHALWRDGGGGGQREDRRRSAQMGPLTTRI